MTIYKVIFSGTNEVVGFYMDKLKADRVCEMQDKRNCAEIIDYNIDTEGFIVSPIVINSGKLHEYKEIMLSVDDEDEPISLSEFIEINCTPDVEPITQEDLNRLVHLEVGQYTYIGTCKVKRLPRRPIITYDYLTCSSDTFRHIYSIKADGVEFAQTEGCRDGWSASSAELTLSKIEEIAKSHYPEGIILPYWVDGSGYVIRNADHPDFKKA